MPFCVETRAILAAAAIAAAAAASPTVTLAAGALQGGTCAGDASAVFYKSIPFAQPPVGSLRFAPPQAYNGSYSGGSRDATQAAPSCVQFGTTFEEHGPQSEDCLYIDVWTPANASSSSGLPVRVWLYGGSNTDGGISDPMYDGCDIASTGTLQVNINYRLGPLGLLALTEAGIGGNQGIQDALLGLQWVQDNIAAFGGDPKKVLLHGQSAGAKDAYVISSLPSAPKLFSAAAFESGAAGYVPPIASVETISRSFAQHLNCSASDISCFQNAPLAAINTTFLTLPLMNNRKYPAVAVLNATSLDFAPCVDGKVVATDPIKQGSRVPAIFGTSANEGTLFALGQFAQSPNPAAAATAADYDAYLVENFGPAASTIKQYYPLSAFNSTPFPPFFAIATVFSDSSFFCPHFRALEKASDSGMAAYSYLFSHAPKCSWLDGVPEAALPLLGATHTTEIPFVFGHTEGLPLPDGNCSFSDVELEISRFLVSAWTSMAATQKPTADDSAWPLWGGAQLSRGINITNSTAPGTIDYSVCALWDKVAAAAGGSGANGTGAANGTSGSGGVSSPTPSSTIASSAASSTVVSSATVFLAGVATLAMAILF